MDSLSIDGSILKGGGQIVRNSISLSALLGKPVSIQNIRLDRNPPGLKNQHRTGALHYYNHDLGFLAYLTQGLELAAQISSAQLTGAINRSSEIEFVPGRINLPNHYRADSVTAGSIALILQVTLPLLLFSSTPLPASTLTLLGGTNATLAPQVDYTKHVFLPFIRKHSGLENCSLGIKKRGYFPKGGGEVELSVIPLSGGQKLRSFSLMNPGRVKSIGGISHFAGLPYWVGDGIVGGAIRRLAKAGFIAGVEDHGPVDVSPELSKERRDVPVDIKCKREPSRLTTGAGSGIVLWAELEGGGFIGGSAVGRKGQAEASIGEEAVDELLKGLDHGGCVDEVEISTFFSPFFKSWFPSGCRIKSSYLWLWQMESPK